MKKITFTSNRVWLNEESLSVPLPASKVLPAWYLQADRFLKEPSGNHYIMPDGGKFPTWKSCPAIYDIMTAGYVYRTPCDIEFFYNSMGTLTAKTADEKYKDFVSPRPEMSQFESPMGYSKAHFAWWADWAVTVPKGYSVLYSQPFNRYDLPFLTTNGIIDNDNINLPGTMPFFIKEGWSGVLPAGTAYAQLIPFKREDWSSDIELEDPDLMYSKNVENFKKYRIPNGGVYQKDVWQRRRYE